MLISFVGSPCSGKTTTAALIFADLKDSGQSVEFIPEQARFYIAIQRVKAGLKPNQRLYLTDVDQESIMQQQQQLEETLVTSCGQTITIIGDSSPLNSYLYMSEKKRQEPLVQAMITKYLSHKPLIFYVHPVPPGHCLDPNRIHDQKFSESLDEKLIPLMTELGVSPIPLTGSSRTRSSQALAVIYSKLAEELYD